MVLNIEKTAEDARGKIMFISYGNKKINLVEIKKNFARGGHYHHFPSEHVIILGKIEYREENIETKEQKIQIITSPYIIKVPPNTAHLLLALEDTIFVEIFDVQYDAINYPKYRKIVEEKIKVVDN